MIYTPLTKTAICLMFDTHRDDVDKGVLPYVFHPYHVAEQMDDEASVCVALLHDVIETGIISYEYLTTIFPREIADAVRVLSRDKKTTYFNYIREIKKNPLATKVKLADIEHNMDMTRYAGCDEETVSKGKELLKRYEKARRILLGMSD